MLTFIGNHMENNINKIKNRSSLPGPECPSVAAETGDVDPCKCGGNDID